MKQIISLASLILLFTFSACNTNTPAKEEQKSDYDLQAEIVEAIQTSNYTYCKVDQSGDQFWIAIQKTEVDKGQTLYFNRGMEMKNFKSKELDRNFPLIYFVQEASTNPKKPGAKLAMPTPVNVNKEVVMEKSADELTLAQIFENTEDYDGKTLSIRGKVVKVNKAIMGKNWIHIQDGTQYQDNFDFTITSKDVPNVGDEVTFEGKISLKKDFGAGYTYDIIMEEGALVK